MEVVTPMILENLAKPIKERLDEFIGDAMCQQYLVARFVHSIPIGGTGSLRERGEQMFVDAFGMRLEDYINEAKRDKVRERCIKHQRAKYGASTLEEKKSA